MKFSCCHRRHLRPISACRRDPAASTATSATPASACAAAAAAPGLGHIALDIAAAHVGSAHGGDGGLGLVRRGEGDESKSFARVISVSDCAVLSKSFLQLISVGLLADVVNKQLGTLHLFSPASSTTAAAATTSTASTSASTVTSLVTLGPGDV